MPHDYAGSVDLEDPPLLTPGMANVVLSPRGRLVSFRAVPPAYVERDVEGSSGTQWSALFTAAGVEEAAVTPLEPLWTPATYADERAAWEGPYPGRPEWRMRIEAAAYQSRPVWFEVMGPWTRPPAIDGAAPASDPLAAIRRRIQIAVGASALIVSAWLARRNVRAGRADRRGAILIGFLTGTPLIVAWLVGGHHAGGAEAAWPRFVVHLSMALYTGALMWLVYLALEPYVRRRWPEALISWSRLLAGRFGDPLVGRDILIGCAAGVAIMAIGDVAEAIPSWIGQPPIAPTGGNSALRALGTAGAFAAEIGLRLTRTLTESLLLLFVILLALLVLRNRWLAYAVITAIFFALGLNREALVLSALQSAALVGVLVLLVSRAGILAFTAAWFVNYIVHELPLSLNTSAWFGARSAIAAGLIVAVAGWGFYRSLAGRSPFGAAFD